MYLQWTRYKPGNDKNHSKPNKQKTKLLKVWLKLRVWSLVFFLQLYRPYSFFLLRFSSATNIKRLIYPYQNLFTFKIKDYNIELILSVNKKKLGPTHLYHPHPFPSRIEVIDRMSNPFKLISKHRSTPQVPVGASSRKPAILK